MEQKRIEQLQVIEDEILLNNDISATTVINARKLAEEDDYLYNLMVDFMKEPDREFKSGYLNDIVNYTEEKLRQSKLR